MRDFFRKKTWIITALMFVASLSLSIAIVYFEFSSRQEIKITNASLSDNVSGYAWSSNVGWVSFNCTNETPSCSGTNYGVNIDPTTGYFSGYAWSSNVGWISFNETGAPDYSFNTSCNTAGSCSASNNCTACYNQTDNKVYGWAKILTIGANGWIKFNGTWQNGVSIDPTSGNFSGWAWNGNDDVSGIGWVSFNCSNETPACSGTNYKVVGSINAPPTATGLTAPNWSFSEAGQYGALNAKPEWTFNGSGSGSSESAYEIIVNTSDSISSPIFDSGKCLGVNNPTSNCKVDNGASGTTDFPLGSAMTLNYNTPYYWWVKVWDNHDAVSSLAQYNSDQDTPVSADDGSPLTFTTYKHKMPDVNFSLFPTNPSRGEKVKFTDASKVYLSSAPETAVNCNAELCRWLWSATVGATIDYATASTTAITFNSSGSQTVTLKVTDNDGYYISTSTQININAGLPKWKEVKPQ